METQKKANQATIDDLMDIHRGLHVAMDAGIRDKNYQVLEVTLRQIDDRLKNLINALKGVNPGTWV